jgi:hypothetical protein
LCMVLDSLTAMTRPSLDTVTCVLCPAGAPTPSLDPQAFPHRSLRRGRRGTRRATPPSGPPGCLPPTQRHRCAAWLIIRPRSCMVIRGAEEQNSHPPRHHRPVTSYHDEHGEGPDPRQSGKRWRLALSPGASDSCPLCLGADGIATPPPCPPPKNRPPPRPACLPGAPPLVPQVGAPFLN